VSKYSFQKISTIGNVDLFNLIGNQTDYSEYNRIPEDCKLEVMLNKIKRNEQRENSISFSVFESGVPVALWLISREDFDSEIFGYDIYRIENLILAASDPIIIRNIINASLNYLAKIVRGSKRESYFLVGLNTNYPGTPVFLNCLLKRDFHYIHTLLTFKMFREDYPFLNLAEENKIKIREANHSDVKEIMNLASKSFKYSRFHLDPILDNDKANQLLVTSAKNSILEGFADIMFVAEYENRVVGYYSARKRIIPECKLILGEAMISAVDENFRRLGIFKQLNKYLLNWFSINTDVAEMGTYISNIPVHKTWCTNGLNIVRATHQLAMIIHP
jgi:hypothetical protein